MTARPKRLSPVQRRILTYLIAGGPARVATGFRDTRTGRSTSTGERWINTNATTLWFLESDRLIIQDTPGPEQPYRANLSHPAVQRLAESRR